MFTRSREGKAPLLFDPEITKSERKKRKQKKRNNQAPEIAMGDQLVNANRTLSEYGNPSLAGTQFAMAITLRSGASYPELRENHGLENSESSMSRSPKKRKMKSSTSGKGIEAEPESKKSSTPGTTKELDILDTELPRPELVSTSGKRNIVPTTEKRFKVINITDNCFKPQAPSTTFE
ncbi:hypothetical protein Dimus_029361 [Dionaea muscipula]